MFAKSKRKKASKFIAFQILNLLRILIGKVDNLRENPIQDAQLKYYNIKNHYLAYVKAMSSKNHSMIKLNKDINNIYQII